jgi:hypothetical protein
MGRVVRHIFTVLAGLSLLLSLVTVVFWIRSYWRHDSWEQDGPAFYDEQGLFEKDVRIISAGGQGIFSWGRADFTVIGGDGRWEHDTDNGTGFYDPTVKADYPLLATAGIYIKWHCELFLDAIPFDSQIHTIAVRDWLLIVVFLILPIIETRRINVRRKIKYRQTHNLCMKCGYDLRATPDRCPECGTIVGKPKAPPQ